MHFVFQVVMNKNPKKYDQFDLRLAEFYKTFYGNSGGRVHDFEFNFELF